EAEPEDLPVAEAQPVEEARPLPIAEAEPEDLPVAEAQPVEEARPLPIAEAEPEDLPVAEAQPVEEAQPLPTAEVDPEDLPIAEAESVEETQSLPVAEAQPVEEQPMPVADVEESQPVLAVDVGLVESGLTLEMVVVTEPEVGDSAEPLQPSEPCQPEAVIETAPAAVAEPAPPWTEGPAVRPEAVHLQCWIAQPDPSGSVIPAAPYRELAKTMHSQGHLREAVYAMGQALQLEPEIGAAWHAQLLADWVDFLDAHQQRGAALRVCQTWSELHPHDSQALPRLHELTPAPEPEVEEDVPCENLGQALEALRTHPGNEPLIKKTLELGQGNEAELMNLFRTLTRDHLDEPLHFRNFARVYLMLNKPILAVVQYQKFLVVRPTADGYRELAHAYTLLNREKNASEALKKAEELATARSM
ncbi:hypothetical protein IV102_37725, partial [bacterium]|nr:hypothetical protein [bacterium]